MYKILITSKAEKQLNRLTREDARRITKEILKLSSPLRRNLDVKKITGQKDFYRLRAGRIRVIFEVNKRRKEIWIRKVGYRGGIYKWF